MLNVTRPANAKIVEMVVPKVSEKSETGRKLGTPARGTMVEFEQERRPRKS